MCSLKGNEQQEIEELFSMFHDFEIISVKKIGDVLTLELVIPWGEVWIPPIMDYQIKLDLIGCRELKCDYFVFKNDEVTKLKPTALRETIRKTTSDTRTISNLGLEIQNFTLFEPDSFILNCNNSKGIAGGELAFTAKDYMLFKSLGEPLPLHKLKQWATQWWDGIQEMWNKENQANDNTLN
ncbi:hypothetical protein GU926_00060 [Nibribacter ruber]|uniref:Uncharacterized protein n=1 Tax=Nibribacter ruber TaxID=2698458 RepID=A0A6P1NSC7_9BACT|nr:hypothetical protein [Nibribacter ruber]QHL85920.1 hypothetical protein GU926_00060 [Nibribacter ruber]